MERTQKQITGRAPTPYNWDDRRYDPARSHTRVREPFRVENVSERRREEAKRAKEEKLRLILLEIATVVVLVLMLSMVIGKLNSITRIKQDQIAVSEIIEMLDAEVSASTTRLNGLKDDEAIKYRARMELGMIQADEYSRHVLSNVKVNTSDEIETAGAGSRK